MFYFDEEQYICGRCKRDFSLEQVEDNWLCPICNNYVLIYAKNESSDERPQINRKLSQDIEEGDHVVFPHGPFTHEVLNVKIKNNKIHLALKEHGIHKENFNEFVNCRVGTWHDYDDDDE